VGRWGTSENVHTTSTNLLRLMPCFLRHTVLIICCAIMPRLPQHIHALTDLTKEQVLPSEAG